MYCTHVQGGAALCFFEYEKKITMKTSTFIFFKHCQPLTRRHLGNSMNSKKQDYCENNLVLVRKCVGLDKECILIMWFENSCDTLK